MKTDTPTSRESISVKSLLTFLVGGISGAFLVILLCCAFLLTGCKTVGLVTRNNGDHQESCVVIKVPSDVRVCFPSSPQPEEPQ